MENVLDEVPTNSSTSPHPIGDRHGLTAARAAPGSTDDAARAPSRRTLTHMSNHGTRAASEKTAHEPIEKRHPAASASGTAKNGAAAVDNLRSME